MLFKTNKSIQDMLALSCLVILIVCIQPTVELSLRSAQKPERHRRTLTLDFETLNGVVNSEETPNHVHLPVDTVMVNISCTITNPSPKYRLKLNKASSYLASLTSRSHKLACFSIFSKILSRSWKKFDGVDQTGRHVYCQSGS
jgi:hypothetical protein